MRTRIKKRPGHSSDDSAIFQDFNLLDGDHRHQRGGIHEGYTPSVWAPDVTWRRPLRRTKVEATPRPLRLMFDVPVEIFWVKASGLF